MNRAVDCVAPRRPAGRPMHRVGRGFTLLELLIAMTLGLVILAASLAVYTSSSRGSQISQVETQMNEDGVLALNIIQEQIKQAGYAKQIIPAAGSTVVMGNYAGVAVRGCDLGFVDAGAAFDSLACNTTGTGSDAIAVRYEATTNNTVPTSAGLPTNCIGNGINAINTSQVSPAPTPAPATYALADNRYMVTAPTTYPSLSCRGNEASGASNAIATSQPLIANVEDMQITYGVATKPTQELGNAYDANFHQIISYLTATQIDSLATSGTLPNARDDRWGRVLSVRVCLLMRSNQVVRDVPTGGFNYKDCSNVDGTSTDGYLRRTYTTTVLLRNRMVTQ